MSAPIPIDLGISNYSYMKTVTYLPLIGGIPRTIVWMCMYSMPNSPEKAQLRNEYLVADVARNLISAALAIAAIAFEIFSYEACVLSLSYYLGSALYCYCYVEQGELPDLRTSES